MLRALGAALVLGSLGWAGWSMGREERRRLETLRELIGALEGMEREMAFRLTPLPDLFARLGEQGGLSPFFRACAACAAGGEEPFETGWRRAVGELAGRLDAGAVECLLRLGRGLGRCDGDGEAARLAAAVEELRLLLAQTGEECRRKSRLWTVLGLTAGAFLVILLI